MVIIGVLAAIGVPTFLKQIAKARAVDAKSTLANINTAQVAFRIDPKHSGFATRLDDLGLGLSATTANYNFTINTAPTGDSTNTIATPTDRSLKGYAGGVVQYFTGPDNDATTRAIICETKTAGTATPAAPTLNTTATTAVDAAQCDATQVFISN